jgi:hypothetical protein
MEDHVVHVNVRLESSASHFTGLELPSNAPLIDVLDEGASKLGTQLLPNPQAPLDRLHDILKHGGMGPAIQNLDQALGAFIHEKDNTKDFAIELVLAFRVNTRWAVAPKDELSPREILALPEINLNFEQYTLYLPSSNAPLPLDTPVRIQRGMAFEAQRDGRYVTESHVS